MKLNEEQKYALELIVQQGVFIYQKVIEESGSVEMAKDIVRQYFIAILHANENPKWIM